MSSRIPIPPVLRGNSISTADSATHGLKRGRLRGRDVDHPFHGVSAVDLDTSTVFGRCRAVEPRLLHGQCFSHTTALALFGAPLPRDLDDEPLHLAVVAPRTPPRARGIRGHTLADGSFARTFRLGFPVVSPADAWALSSTLLSRGDLVAAGDFLVTGRRHGRVRESALLTIAELTDAALRFRGHRGSSLVTWALPRVRVGPGSRTESLLRLLLASARLPEPAIQHPIPVSTGKVLHPDLALVESRIVLEYEGDDHRVDRATWLSDLERRELLEEGGWRVVRVTSRDLFERPDAFIARLRRLIAARR